MREGGEGLLYVSGLSVAVGRGDGAREIVKDVSFQVASGESFGIVGESGSGKTLTCLAITRLLPEGVPFEVRGAASLRLRNGREVDLLQAPPGLLARIRGREVGMIFQQPGSSLNPVLRIGDQIAEGVRRHLQLTGKEALARARELLERVRMPEPKRVMKALPHELSGGMQQRAMIAMALGPGPRLLVADEPTTSVDVIVQEGLLNLLGEICREDGMTLLLVSHDLRVVRRMCGRIAVMAGGRMVEERPAEDFFREPPPEDLHPLADRLFASRLRLDVFDPARSLDTEPASTPSSAGGEFPEGSGEDVILEVEGLERTFRTRRGRPGGRRLVKAVAGVSFRIRRGTTYGLVGASGSGKSTLARLLLRLDRPDAGRILFDGEDWLALRGSGLRRKRRRQQVVFQDPILALDPRLSVGESLMEPLLVAPGACLEKALEESVRLMDLVGLSQELLGRLPHELSGGERQRVTLARALATDPLLIILDEALSSLDASLQMDVLELLGRLQEERGLSYLLISHDLAVVQRVSHEVGVMHAGRLVEEGPTERVLFAPEHPRTRALIEAAS